MVAGIEARSTAALFDMRGETFVCALTMGIGTSFGGWRIIETVGLKMTRITSWQGFAVQPSPAFTIFGASHFGIPLSTTHTSAVVGASASVPT